MTTKWIGAMLVIAGCGGFGFSLAAAHRREVRELQGLLRSLEFMQWELTYRLTPLPELCAQAGREAGGVLMKVFSDLSGELNRQISPDVPSCMQVSLGRYRSALTPRGRKLLFQLGRSLGRFDLAGQLSEVGVILLMFGVGLHFSLKDLLQVKSVAVPGATAVTLPLPSTV